ncbi:MAG: hypothetical protein ABI565_10640, partial [Vicinamibacteria bacterium]
GNLEASLRMWTIIRDQAEPGVMKENAEIQLKVVRNRLFTQQIQERITAYRERTEDHASGLDELRAKGVISASRDMAGVSFEFDPDTGILAVAKNSPLWRRPASRH